MKMTCKWNALIEIDWTTAVFARAADQYLFATCRVCCLGLANNVTYWCLSFKMAGWVSPCAALSVWSRCFTMRVKEREAGEEKWRRGVVAPERRVQLRGNERLPALHHSQGLPQSAGGQGQRPHVSFLLPCLLPPQCVCAFLLVTEKMNACGHRGRVCK